MGRRARRPVSRPGFVSRLFKEDDGKPSFSRVFSAVIIFAVIAWVTAVLVKDGKLPDLSGAALVLSGSLGVLYGANKVATSITSVSQK